MQTLESLLGSDFDIKTFDYDPIKAGLTPDGSKDWQDYVAAGVNNEILEARVVPILNKFIGQAKEALSACTQADNSNPVSRDIIAAFNLCKQAASLKPLNMELPEARIENTIKINELNDILCANRKFCAYIKKWDFWSNYRVAEDARSGRSFAKFISDDEIDTTKCLAEFEALRLKLPTCYELTTSTNQEGCVIIKIRIK